jgi:hypothetical protein
MIAVREPTLKPVAIADLRPTQITVGMREVYAKRKHWQAMKADKRSKFLAAHMIPDASCPKLVRHRARKALVSRPRRRAISASTEEVSGPFAAILARGMAVRTCG